MELSVIEKEIESLTSDEIITIFPWASSFSIKFASAKFTKMKISCYEHNFFLNGGVGVLSPKNRITLENYVNEKLSKKREIVINEIIK
tara:strand:+ start:17594 stop:17857 length:264 start_codon:yes stop_codon:yes gene_type:complete